MATASPQLPPLIHRDRFARNGLYPDAAFYGAATQALNHCLAFRRKPLFQRTVPLGTSGGASGTAWRWHCRTGYGVRRVAVFAVLGLDDRHLAVAPSITVTLTEVGGAALPAVSFAYGASNVTATDAPDELLTAVQFIDVDPATDYTGEVLFVDNVRVISLLVYEAFDATVDDSLDYFSTFRPAGGSPIFDAWVGRGLAALAGMLHDNLATRLDWMRADGTARTRTSATLINLIDDTTVGTPTAASPGYTLDTEHRYTIGKVQVPVTLAVYGSIPAGSGVVRLRDTGGTSAVVATINNATPQWFTATGALSVGAAQKYDLQFAGDGANQVSILAVSIYQR